MQISSFMNHERRPIFLELVAMVFPRIVAVRTLLRQHCYSASILPRQFLESIDMIDKTLSTTSTASVPERKH